MCCDGGRVTPEGTDGRTNSWAPLFEKERTKTAVLLERFDQRLDSHSLWTQPLVVDQLTNIVMLMNLVQFGVHSNFCAMCHKIRLPSVHCALLAALLVGANQTLCQLLGAPGGCATIAMLNAQQPGASPQAPSFQQPFAPSFGCPLSALGAFGRQFPPPPPPSPGVAGGQFPMHGQSGNFPVNVMNPNFMGSSSQQQQNGGGAGGNNNFGTSGNNCNCGPCCSDGGGGGGNSFGMPSTGGGEFGGAIVGAGLNNMNNNNVNGIAGGGGGGTIDMVNGGMGVFGRRRRR
ncbi:hypothetical protein GPALN_004062 [Globodera pallida]|nr:hypothetical protein GPALN_004062 [Globodera pallida]